MVNLSVCRSAVATYGFSVDTIISYYQEWVVEPFYVVVVGFNKLKCDYEYRAFRSAKRGDSKYSFKVRERFDALKHAVDKGVEWFNWRETDRVKISSPCIYITLTYDRSHDLEDSWLEVGRDFNRYISRLRRKYGKIHVVRAFESHKDGYCHVHAVLLFDSVMWRGFRHTGANGFVTFRVDAVARAQSWLAWWFR
jgi:hypothetical protein